MTDIPSFPTFSKLLVKAAAEIDREAGGRQSLRYKEDSILPHHSVLFAKTKINRHKIKRYKVDLPDQSIKMNTISAVISELKSQATHI